MENKTKTDEINRKNELLADDTFNSDLIFKLKENTLSNNQKTADLEINKLKGITTEIFGFIINPPCNHMI